MKEFKILPYDSSYNDKLYAYLKRISANHNDKYIDYCIEQSEGTPPSVLVTDACDNIVGCHLFFSSEVFAKGEKNRISWGHETFLDEDYRSSAGVDFVLSIHGNNTLGIGLSDINKKLLKKMKLYVWAENVFNYFLLDIFFPLGLLKKLLGSRLKPLKIIKSVKAGVEFRLVKNVDSIVVPQEGFWYKALIDYDLIRDKDYIDYRFVSNKVFDYSVYEYHNQQGDTCYFVIRPILYKGIPTLLLVDYRFHGDDKLMGYILSAVKKIARKNHIGVIQTTGGIKDVERAFDTFLCIKRQAECVIHKSLKPQRGDYISITPADSDVDFNR